MQGNVREQVAAVALELGIPLCWVAPAPLEPGTLTTGPPPRDEAPVGELTHQAHSSSLAELVELRAENTRLEMAQAGMEGWAAAAVGEAEQQAAEHKTKLDELVLPTSHHAPLALTRARGGGRCTRLQRSTKNSWTKRSRPRPPTIVVHCVSIDIWNG
jgi:hypothetical protein